MAGAAQQSAQSLGGASRGMRRNSHFRAEIRIHNTEHGGPRQGFFYFPESGERNVPLGMAGVAEYNTVKLCYQPAVQVPNGSTFVADCLLITEEPYLQIIAPGRKLELWDGRIFASGCVLELFPENWRHELGPPKRPF